MDHASVSRVPEYAHAWGGKSWM